MYKVKDPNALVFAIANSLEVISESERKEFIEQVERRSRIYQTAPILGESFNDAIDNTIKNARNCVLTG